ncbi:MAG: VF530 family protein [Mariprofundaceae bacterium]
MSEKQINNPLHGITLEMMLNELVEHYGWGELGIHVRIKCFNNDPSVKSSLKFLRRTPWARSKVENLYLDMLDEKERQKNSPWPGGK